MASTSGEKITLVIAEMEDNAISNATYEVLRAGIELVEGIGGKLCTVIAGFSPYLICSPNPSVSL